MSAKPEALDWASTSARCLINGNWRIIFQACGSSFLLVEPSSVGPSLGKLSGALTRLYAAILTSCPCISCANPPPWRVGYCYGGAWRWAWPSLRPGCSRCSICWCAVLRAASRCKIPAYLVRPPASISIACSAWAPVHRRCPSRFCQWPTLCHFWAHAPLRRLRRTASAPPRPLGADRRTLKAAR